MVLNLKDRAYNKQRTDTKYPPVEKVRIIQGMYAASMIFQYLGLICTKKRKPNEIIAAKMLGSQKGPHILFIRSCVELQCQYLKKKFKKPYETTTFPVPVLNSKVDDDVEDISANG